MHGDLAIVLAIPGEQIQRGYLTDVSAGNSHTPPAPVCTVALM